MSSEPYFFQCINCTHLGHCAETSAEKILEGYVCSRWQETSQEVYAARYQIVQLFGKSGLKAIVSKDLKEEED